MELRQLRYFVKAVEVSSMARAAHELGVVQSGLSQQIARLESELETTLFQRHARGVIPTEAGIAFFREAQLTLRHADQAQRAARQARLTGAVSIGLAPTTTAVLGMPFMVAMRERYPSIRLHMVEAMAGHLATMLNARQLDLALLFSPPERGMSVIPLLEEKLLFIRGRQHFENVATASRRPLRIQALAELPFLMPTGAHGLRAVIEAAFKRAGIPFNVVGDIDSLPMLMDAVEGGLGVTLQPGAAVGRYPNAENTFHLSTLSDRLARRQNTICGLPDDQLPPVALAARLVLAETARRLVAEGKWPGAVLPPG